MAAIGLIRGQTALGVFYRRLAVPASASSQAITATSAQARHPRLSHPPRHPHLFTTQVPPSTTPANGPTSCAACVHTPIRSGSHWSTARPARCLGQQFLRRGRAGNRRWGAWLSAYLLRLPVSFGLRLGLELRVVVPKKRANVVGGVEKSCPLLFVESHRILPRSALCGDRTKTPPAQLILVDLPLFISPPLPNTESSGILIWAARIRTHIPSKAVLDNHGFAAFSSARCPARMFGMA